VHVQFVLFLKLKHMVIEINHLTTKPKTLKTE